MDFKRFRNPFLQLMIFFVWLLWIISGIAVPCLCPETICSHQSAKSKMESETEQSCCATADYNPTNSTENSFSKPKYNFHFCEHSQDLLGKGIHRYLDDVSFQLWKSATFLISIEIDPVKPFINFLSLPFLTYQSELIPNSFWGRTLPLLS